MILLNNSRRRSHSAAASEGLDQRYIAQAINDQLQRAAYLGLRTVCCELNGGAFVLRGVVYTYYLKQMAQAIAGRFTSSHQLRNEIEVHYDVQCSDSSG